MKAWSLYILLKFLVFIRVHCLHLHSFHKTNRALVHIHVTEKASNIVLSRRVKRTTNIADSLHVATEGDTFRKIFLLEFIQEEDSYIPVFLNGKVDVGSSLTKFQSHYYRCTDNECLFRVEKTRPVNGSFHQTEYKLFGTFHVDVDLHILESTPDGLHVIYIPEVPQLLQFDSDDRKGSRNDTKHGGCFGGNIRPRHKRATGSYQVELLMVVDYSAFQFWLTEKNSIRADAVEAIKQFYAFMIKGVNLRFQNLPGATYSITVVNAGLYIIEDASSAAFIEDIKTCPATSGARCSVDAQQALTVFKTWMETTSGIPPNDHAMLFTRYDVGLGSVNSATGYAYTGKVCTDQSYSIVEEDFNFITQTIAAHELGHSLNAVHDGTDNACAAEQRNIMAAVSSAVSGGLAQNPWKFSTCTTQEINGKLDELLSSTSNCLLSAVSGNHQSLSSYLSVNLGQVYSPDVQCRMVLGQSSYACRNIYASDNSYESLCTGLWCNNPSLTDRCSLIIPAEHTTCGSQKWCDGYQCTYSMQAPPASADCVLGDQTDIVVSGLTCASLISQQPWQCYNDVVQQRCCQSCKAKETTYSDCKYGDKLDCSQINSYGCYTGNNGVDCCQTCRPYITTIQNCRFGDRSDCSALTHGSQCYSGNNGDLCCQTCHQYKTTITGCEYGDRATNCAVNLCLSYSATDRNSCCKTCHGVTTTTTTTTTAAQEVTTTKSSSKLPDWVIPVAAGAGGGLLLLIVVIVIVCCVLKSRRGSHNRTRTDRRSVQHPRHQGNRQHGRSARQSRDVIIQPSRSRQYPRAEYIRGGQHYVNNGYSRY